MIDGPSNSESVPEVHTLTQPDTKNNSNLPENSRPMTEAEALEQRTKIRESISSLWTGGKAATDEEIDKLVGEIESYAHSPFFGKNTEPEYIKPIKTGFLASVRRKLGI